MPMDKLDSIVIGEVTKRITELVEHDQVEPRQLRRQGPAFADPGLLFEACHQASDRATTARPASSPDRRD